MEMSGAKGERWDLVIAKGFKPCVAEAAFEGISWRTRIHSQVPNSGKLHKAYLQGTDSSICPSGALPSILSRQSIWENNHGPNCAEASFLLDSSSGCALLSIDFDASMK